MRWLLTLCLIGFACVVSAAKFDTLRWDCLYAIDKDGSIEVTELIAVRYKEPQHGFIRKIPEVTQAANGDRRQVNVLFRSANLDAGNGFDYIPCQTSHEAGDVVFKIGSSSKTLSGNATFRLVYTVRGALTPIERKDELGPRAELQWNVWPGGWSTEIPAGTTTITWPKPKAGPVAARVVAGQRGSRQGLQVEYGGSRVGRSELVDVRFASAQKLEIVLKSALPSGQFVTVALALPKGTVKAEAPRIYAPPQATSQPSAPDYSPPYEPRQPDLFDKIGSGTPWLAGIPLLGAALIYLLSRGKWGRPERPLVVRFDPPEGISAPLSGTIIDNVVNPSDVVSGIVGLAQRGVLRMHHAEDGVQIEVLDLARARGIDQFEQALYGYLAPFGPLITPDMLRGNFGANFHQLESLLRAEGAERGIFAQTAGVKAGLGCLLVALVVVSTFFLCIFSPLVLGGAFVAMLLGFIFIGKISYVTPKGQEIRRDIEGLREFITRAHRHELNYMAERDPDQAMFERLLPYAVAFDAVQQWTKAFEGIDLQMPDWYAGSSMGDVFWMSMLMNDLTYMNQDYGQAMTYVQPAASSFNSGDTFSSGGSGFDGGWSDSGGGGFDGGIDAGGGGGGGGGDSW